MIRLQGNHSTYLFDPTNERTILRKNGHFSIVFLGKDEGSGKTIVVKQLHPRHRKSVHERTRFINEYRPDLKSPYFATSLDLVDAQPDLYLIREYKDGTDLKSWMEKGHFSRMKKEERRRFLLSLLETLGGLHELGYIHGDIKPSNFIVAENGQLSMIDLGLLLPLEVSKRPAKNDRHPLPFSLIYSAPELMLDFPDLLDKSTDIYSMGIIWYELLSGRLPWEEKIPAILMNLQMVYPLPAVRGITGEMLTFLNRMSAKHAFSSPPFHLAPAKQRAGCIAALQQRFPDVDAVRMHFGSMSDEQVFAKKWWIFG